MEWISEAQDIFGNRLGLLIALGFLAYWLLLLAPFLLPARRAFSKRDRLPRPWLFILLVGGLAYGWTEFIVTLLAIPGAFFLVYVAPTLQDAGHLGDSWLLSFLAGFVKWWWTAMPLAFFVIALWLTRWLGRRWRMICEALAV
jgi:hypothetical protein